MNKNKQKLLLFWLKTQSAKVRYWIRFSLILGLVNGVIIVFQSGILAYLLQKLIMENAKLAELYIVLIILLGFFIIRALIIYWRDRVNFITGSNIRQQIRSQILDHLEYLGPSWIHGKPTGSWSSILLEQIEDLHDFYARYLPQMYLSILIPLLMLIFIFPINWIAGLILLFTAPLIPLFMKLIGIKAADANQRNFVALARLAGYFLDRLRGLDTLRLFFRAHIETKNLHRVSEDLRRRTMEVLRIAFLSSGVLEFFISISIALLAVYFGFTYIGKLHFYNYGTNITLFAGFFILILAPEFFQPLRDLGIFYHAKAKAIGAAESLVNFLDNKNYNGQYIGNKIPTFTSLRLTAYNLIILATDGTKLIGPLNFNIISGQRIAIIGISGAGKSTLINLLLGFLPYRGSLLVNDIEFRTISLDWWRKQLSWIGQNPLLPEKTIRENILLGSPLTSNIKLKKIIYDVHIKEFLKKLPNGLDSIIGSEYANLLSTGQAQRIAIARALIREPMLLLLDEPTANLDIYSQKLIMQTLDIAMQRQTTILITHQLSDIKSFDIIWVMEKGKIIQQGSYTNLAIIPGPLADLIALTCK